MRICSIPNRSKSVIRIFTAQSWYLLHLLIVITCWIPDFLLHFMNFISDKILMQLPFFYERMLY